MNIVHVKTAGHFLKDGKRLLNPGSVIPLDKDTAKEFVKRGLGELHPGPEFEAPAPEESAEASPGRRPERADLGNRIANAERATARPQAAAAR